MKKRSERFKPLVQRPMITGALILVCMHVTMLILTIVSHGFPIFIMQNIAALLFFAIMWLLHCLFSLKQIWVILITCLGAWVQIGIAIACVGLDAGFQFYCFGTLVAAFFLTFSTKTEQTTFVSSFVELGSVIIFLTSIIHGRNLEPLYTVPPRDLFITSCINNAFVLLVITFFADSYRLRLVSAVHSQQSAADCDDLTGLFNRRGVRRYFDRLHEDWVSQGIPYIVAILDIDDFKVVNDTWGHNQGDRVLVEIARILSHYSNEMTWSCRWGGEEFLILSQVKKSRTVNMQILNTILSDIRKISIPVNDDVIQVTATIGCAFSGQDIMIHELLNKADSALYRGKMSGKNQVVPAE